MGDGLEQWISQGYLGPNYRDGPETVEMKQRRQQQFNSSSLGTLLQQMSLAEQERRLRLKQQALLFKYNNPQMHDHDIGRQVLRNELDIDLNNALFNHALRRSQKQLGQIY